MPRTTDAQVKELFEDTITASRVPFIAVANALVTRACVTDDSEYSSADLELIERWLAAHFYTVRAPVPTSESAGGVSQSLSVSVEVGLGSSMYGQTAMTLDTEGGLAALNAATKDGARRKVGFFGPGPSDSIGTEYSR
jgi:hypothetical protein